MSSLNGEHVTVHLVVMILTNIFNISRENSNSQLFKWSYATEMIDLQPFVHKQSFVHMHLFGLGKVSIAYTNLYISK